MSTVVVHQCPQCGAPIGFDVASQTWQCKYCGGICEKGFQPAVRADAELSAVPTDSAIGFNLPQTCSTMNPQIDPAAQADFEAKAEIFNCPSCGAELMVDANTAATSCAYCNNPTLLKSRLSGAYYPVHIIPLKITKDQAKSLFAKGLKGKPLLPKCFKDQRKLNDAQGVYLPFWLFDCDVAGGMQAKATIVRTYNTARHIVTETSHYDVVREGTSNYRKVPADASKRLDSNQMEMLEPYNYEELCDFNMGYLSGYVAEKYDKVADECFPRVNKRVGDYIQKKLHSTVTGFTSVRVTGANHTVPNCQSNYTLLPVWMLTYNYNGKDWHYAVNGQTGRIVGDLPISKGKLWGWFGGIAVAAMTIITALGGFMA